MAVVVHERGWLDTSERIARVFKEDKLIKSLMTRNGNGMLDATTLEEQEASRWALMMTYGAYVVQGGPVPDMSHIRAVAIGELLAPALPVSYFLGPEAANEKIKQIVLYYMHHETPLSRGKSRANYTITHNELPEDARPADWVRVEDAISDNEFLTRFGELFCNYLVLDPTADQSMKLLDLYTSVYIAVAKRGNVTTEFLNKVATGLMDDLQFEANLDEEVINLVYKFYGGHINADNAPDVLERWLQDIR